MACAGLTLRMESMELGVKVCACACVCVSGAGLTSLDKPMRAHLEDFLEEGGPGKQ